jgi:3-deoxy-D-manno-octulosonate 8-phosphate phosphatase (KDO 8-P phosphatase)
VSDVDGVLTDGRIHYSADAGRVSHEMKSLHARAGLGIKFWMRSGFPFGIITARQSKLVTHRAKELGIQHVVQAASDKWAAAQEMMQDMGVTADQVCYIGDDIPDLCVMQHVGLAVAPDDAATDAREAAHWITRSRGGEGVIREVTERLLRAGKHWQDRLSELNKTATADSKPRSDDIAKPPAKER